MQQNNFDYASGEYNPDNINDEETTNQLQKKLLLPGYRAAHACSLVGHSLYVYGGWNGENALDDLYKLDLDHPRLKQNHALNTSETLWIQIQPTGNTKPPPRNNHASTVVGNKIIVHGGHDGIRWLDDLYMLDIDKMEWICPSFNGAGILPSARACHTLTKVGGKLYMFGGYNGEKCYDDVDVLDLETMSWIRPIIQGTKPSPRNAHTMTLVGKSRLFLYGGHSGACHLRDLHILDVLSQQGCLMWSTPDISGCIPPGVRGHTANLVRDKIFLFGGYDGRGSSSDLYILDTKKMEWTHPSGSQQKLLLGRQRHTTTLVGSHHLYVIGGFDGYKWLKDVNIIDVAKVEATTITDLSVNRLVENLRNIINNEHSFPDVRFRVENKIVYAHKAILASQCDQFRAMFTHGMIESHAQVIDLPLWTHASFILLLEFLYTGSMRTFSHQNAIDLLGLADHYTLDKLTILCENSLIQIVEHDNVAQMLSLAHQHQAKNLKRYCMSFILKNFEAVQETPGFDTLAATEPQLLVEVMRLSVEVSSMSTS